jgi:hypothetical protein
MKYIKQIPTEDTEEVKRLTNSGWKRLKEPRTFSRALIVATPIMILLLVAEVAFLHQIFPTFLNFNADHLAITINLVSLVDIAVVVGSFWVHEVLHALCLPNGLRSKKTYWGFKAGNIFIYSEEVMGRTRFMLVSFAPYLLLSILLPIAFAGIGVNSRVVWAIAILNAGGACIDTLNALLVWRQVPEDADIVNLGTSTFYRK